MLITELEKIITVMLVFGVCGLLKESVIVITSIMLIRFFMGGYHQKTTLGCSLHTIVTLISIIFLSRRILLPQYAVAIVLLLCIIEIWFTTPINTEHRMEYSELQKVRFKLKAMTSLVIISIFVQYSSCGIKNLIVWSVIYQLIEVVVVVLYKQKTKEEKAE